MRTGKLPGYFPRKYNPLHGFVLQIFVFLVAQFVYFDSYRLCGFENNNPGSKAICVADWQLVILSIRLDKFITD